MTCAVALASRHDCIVHVFERDSVLLRCFREAPFRYVHPDLNTSLQADYRYDPTKATELPFLNWSGNYAHLVAEEVCRKFQHYVESFTIALHMNEPVTNVRSGDSGRPIVLLDHAQRPCELECDIVILATGFGLEKAHESVGKQTDTNDFSYWQSGRPSDYRPTRTTSVGKERVLIVGNGDSGVTELAHYLIAEFNHRDILMLMPMSDPDIRYSEYLQQLHFRQIEGPNDNYPDVEGPIGWYWNIRYLHEENGARCAPANFWGERGSIIARLLARIYGTLHQALGDYPIDCNAPSETREAALRKVNRHLSELASLEIPLLIRKMPFEKIYSKEFSEQFDNRFDLTIVGNSPTIYSIRQAPVNWFLLGVLEKYGTFIYRQAELRVRTKTVAGRLRVALKLKTETALERIDVDRLIRRFGPNFEVLGYGKDLMPDLRLIQNAGTQRRILGWTIRRGVFRNELLEEFRTSRWRAAVKRTRPLMDRSYNDPLQVGTLLNVESLLLRICLYSRDTSIRNDASDLFRIIKTDHSSQKGLDARKKLLTLTQQVMPRDANAGRACKTGGGT